MKNRQQGEKPYRIRVTNLLKEGPGQVVFVEVPKSFYDEWHRCLRRMKYVEREKNWNTGKPSGPRMQINALSDELRFARHNGPGRCPGEFVEPVMVNVFTGDEEDVAARELRLKLYDCIDEALDSLPNIEESLILDLLFTDIRDGEGKLVKPLSQSDVALLLGVSRSTVHNRYKSGMRTLACTLADIMMREFGTSDISKIGADCDEC